MREFIEKTKDLNQTISDIWYILRSIWIPKGVVITNEGEGYSTVLQRILKDKKA